MYLHLGKKGRVDHTTVSGMELSVVVSFTCGASNALSVKRPFSAESFVVIFPFIGELPPTNGG
jgi:hypothetical protein